MSPLPSQMVDRWANRDEPRADQGQLYWHVLFDDYPQVQALASAAQERLADFPGHHLTPQRWLHLTTLPVGLTEQFTDAETSQMVRLARDLLSEQRPIKINLSKIFDHPQAITIRVRPSGALEPLLHSVRRAACQAIGEDRTPDGMPWTPHVTIAYSTTVQPVGPILARLGYELPACEVDVASIDLVVQEGPERLWNWRSAVGDSR